MNQKKQPLILAIDGHDGAGKTTMATLLAQATGGAYLRPFGGKTGAALIEYAAKKDYQRVSDLGKAAIDKVLLESHQDILVFDRHWMTIFTLIPEAYYQDWLPLPATTLCYAGISTTLQRLAIRTEETFDRDYHTGYLEQYFQLGKTFGAHILRTDEHGQDACLAQLVTWATNI
jgi:MoxR-like ATPase